MKRMRDAYARQLAETRASARAARGPGARARGQPRVSRHLRRLRSGAPALGLRVLRPARQGTERPRLVLGFRAHLKERHGPQAPDLHGQPLDDAGRPARCSSDARRTSRRSSATPPAATTPSAGRRKRPSTTRASGSRRSSAPKDAKRLSSRSGATESDNLAIKGVAEFYKDKGNHIITTVDRAQGGARHVQAAREGGLRGHLPPRRQGRPGRPGRRRKARSPTRRSSCQRDAREQRDRDGAAHRGDRRRSRASEGVLFHSDAVQGVGKIDVRRPATTTSTSRRSPRTRSYGPEGRRRPLRPPQQAARAPRRADGRRRSRARDALGDAATCRSSSASARRAEILAPRGQGRERAPRRAARATPTSASQAQLDETFINGSMEHRAARATSTSASTYVEGEGLMMAHQGRGGARRGSACTSATLEPSYVLRALGVGDELAHTRASASASAASTPRKRSTTWPTSWSARSSKLRDLSPLYEMAQRRHRYQEHPVGGALRPASDQGQERHGVQRRKSSSTTRTRGTSGTLDKDDPSVGTGLVGAPACGDVMRLQIKVNDAGRHRGREVQDVRLRLGDRVVVARHRVGQGHDASTRPMDDQEHPDRRGAEPAAGEDPLLGPGRGRHQERHRRLPEEAGRAPAQR